MFFPYRPALAGLFLFLPQGSPITHKGKNLFPYNPFFFKSHPLGKIMVPKVTFGRSHLPLTLVKQGRAQDAFSLRSNPYGFSLVFLFLPQEVLLRR